jgi:hypothetical protein
MNVESVRSLQRGLLSCRGLLQSLGLVRCKIGCDELEELRRIYDSNSNIHVTALTALSLTM